MLGAKNNGKTTYHWDYNAALHNSIRDTWLKSDLTLMEVISKSYKINNVTYVAGSNIVFAVIDFKTKEELLKFALKEG